MTRHSLLAGILVATTALGGAAYAAEHAAPPMTAQAPITESPAQKSVDRDVIKLSADGAAAYRDMGSARLALFEVEPSRAKTFIERAQSALAKAKSDDAVFTRAEADLHQPTNAKARTETRDTTSDSAEKAVAWLPVDSQLTLGEDFVPTPEKNAAIADADHSLRSGDRKAATETLRLAGINVNTTVAVLPLAKTTEDVQRAAGLIDQGKYYEANAVLKQAEDRMRFDVADLAMVPDTAAVTAPKATPSKPEASRVAPTKDTQSHPAAAMDGMKSDPGTAAAPQPVPAPAKSAS